LRIRLLKDIETLKAGTIVFLSDDDAREFIRKGEAMEDKSTEPKETK